jgi:hypothetical protein
MEEQNKNNKSLVTLIVVLAVLVVGYVLWISYANKKIREVADASIAHWEQVLSAKGNNATITYDDLKVHGFSLRPRASVYKMHLKLVDPMRRREMHVMVPEVVYIPTNFRMSSYTLEALEGVSISTTRAGQDQENMLIEFSTVPALHVDEKAQGEMAYTLDLPTTISMTDADIVDAASADKTDVVFDAKPQVNWSIDGQGNSLDQEAIFPRTVIAHNQIEKAAADGFSAITTHRMGEAGMVTYDSLVKLDNLTFANPHLEVLNPVNVMNDISYTGPLAQTENAAVKPVSVEIRNLAWVSGLMSLFASGEVQFDPSKEKMPYGNLNVRFDDVDTLLTYAREQQPQTEAYLAKLRQTLEQLAGAEIEQGGSVTINLQREPGGHLRVGNMSLEEALASFIGLAMELPELDFSDDDSASSADTVTTEEEVTEESEGEVEEKTIEGMDDATEETMDETEMSPAGASDDEHVIQQPTKPEDQADVEVGVDSDEVSVEVEDSSSPNTSEDAVVPVE